MKRILISAAALVATAQAQFLPYLVETDEKIHLKDTVPTMNRYPEWGLKAEFYELTVNDTLNYLNVSMLAGGSANY